jgi:hypothetical protein
MGRMQSTNRGPIQRPLWIITSYQNTRINTLTIDSDGGDGSFLAIFSFKEEAEAYLNLLEDNEKRGWRSRETTVGELTSLLLGSCAGVRWVALDPLPLACTKAMLPLMSVSRERFVQDLMEERRKFIETPVPA